MISPIALEAVKRIDALFEIERSVNGCSAAERLKVRQEQSAPLVAELESWLRDQRSRLSRSAAVAEPIDYLLKRWPAFTRFLDDGQRDPAYLMALADKKSSLLPDNKARTSSAEGLFQFIETTWLEVLRRYGPKHGHAAEAEAIQIVESRPVVSDAKQREAILGFRRYPYLSALMAGEMANTHREILAGKTARDPSFAELYMAHFLGVQGARRFVELLSDKPERRASGAVPRAAKANRPLFYANAARKRKALTVAEVHGRLDTMIAQRVTRYASIRRGLAPHAHPSARPSAIEPCR